MLTKYLTVFFVTVLLSSCAARSPSAWGWACRCGRCTSSPSSATCSRCRSSSFWPAGCWSGARISRVIGKFFTFCLEKGHEGGEKLKAKAGRGLPWALLLFVGIPLPGTGAWTGTLAASLLDMDFKSSVRACMGGVLLAGCIMGVVSLLGFSAFGAIAG